MREFTLVNDRVSNLQSALKKQLMIVAIILETFAKLLIPRHT